MTCLACNELRKARDELYVELGKARAECERLEQRERLWREYVDLLSEDLRAHATWAHIHGGYSPKTHIAQGRELRAKLGIEQ